ncbi:MAG TPA: TIM-barrel domain-containing protein [Polyangiaceae bacterium]|jgi:alpha-D-xyloside xylohydrolase|nr:TIM-barrel domain-containing protein [Polyangiaceae bacterium]
MGSSRAAVACVLVACSSSPPPPDPACLPGVNGHVDAPPIHTPRWAFEPWLSKDYSSTDDTLGFVQGSIDRGIPVGVAVLDSPWETSYNTFTPDESATRYHDFANLVSTLQSKGVRTVVWITQFVNVVSYDVEVGAQTHYDGPSPNFDIADHCGFFVDQGQTYPWYKGSGAALDFFNGSALAWWHAQQDALLALGIGGYKVDFGDAYVPTDPVSTAQGPIPHQQYSEAYYEDLLAYGASKRPPGDFLTMVRGWDVSYGFQPRTYARPENAPVVWAGDNRRDWVGVADVLNTSFMNAQLGYPMMGSDLGGYLNLDDQNLLGPEIPWDPLVFERWTEMSALMPLMQLHSREDIMPWTVPTDADEITANYKYWATLHHELVPFMYSLAEETYAKHRSGILAFVAGTNDWRFTIGDAFFVAPILDETGIRDVVFPDAAKYYDWFAPPTDAVTGTLAQYDSSARERYPLFVREGAIVPMNVTSGQLDVLVYPSATSSSFTLYEDDDTTTMLSQSLAANAVTITLARAVKPAHLVVRIDGAGTSTATLNGAPVTVTPDAPTRTVAIDVAASPSAQTLVVTTN